MGRASRRKRQGRRSSEPVSGEMPAIPRAGEAISNSVPDAKEHDASLQQRRERPVPRKIPGAWQKKLARARRPVQFGIGAAIWFAVSYLGISLWWVVGLGSALGLLLGKVFCRWMCPLGFFMETMMGAGDARQASLYQYFKVGCPIAWVGGLLNRLSLLRMVEREESPCATCGRCDDACYITQHHSGYSLYQEGKANPSEHFACSRCMACVEACPTGRIALGTGIASKAA